MKTRPHALLPPLLTAMLLGLAACASAPPPRLLSLPLPPQPKASAAEEASPHVAHEQAGSGVLIVRRVNLPEYLQSDKVRFRASDSVLAEWPGVVWAERLESSMTEQLVLRLRTALPDWNVCERACPASPASTTLTVDLAPLDYVRGTGELRAQARWQLALRAPRMAQQVPPQTTQSKAKAPDALALLSGERGLKVPVAPDNAEGQAIAITHVLDAVAQGVAADVRRQAAAPAQAISSNP